MATLKAKVRHQLVKVKEQSMYVAHSTYASKIGIEEMIKLAADDSGMTEAMVAAAFYAISKQFEQMLFNGHILQCGIFGTFRTSFSCKATNELKEMSTDNITRRRIIYTASPRLKQAHNNATYEFE
jgi:predicted histone-like DNA-binding protein